MDQLRKQAERFGAELVADDVTEVDLRATPKQVKAGEDTYLRQDRHHRDRVRLPGARRAGREAAVRPRRVLVRHV